MKLTLENIPYLTIEIVDHLNLHFGDEVSQNLFDGNYEFQLQTWAPKGVRVLFSSKAKFECEKFRAEALIKEKQYNETCEVDRKQVKGYCYEIANSTIELEIIHTYNKLKQSL